MSGPWEVVCLFYHLTLTATYFWTCSSLLGTYGTMNNGSLSSQEDLVFGDHHSLVSDHLVSYLSQGFDSEIACVYSLHGQFFPQVQLELELASAV
jgi:hypothetical protein